MAAAQKKKGFFATLIARVKLLLFLAVLGVVLWFTAPLMLAAWRAHAAARAAASALGAAGASA